MFSRFGKGKESSFLAIKIWGRVNEGCSCDLEPSTSAFLGFLPAKQPKKPVTGPQPHDILRLR